MIKACGDLQALAPAPRKIRGTNRTAWVSRSYLVFIYLLGTRTPQIKKPDPIYPIYHKIHGTIKACGDLQALAPAPRALRGHQTNRLGL